MSEWRSWLEYKAERLQRTNRIMKEEAGKDAKGTLVRGNTREKAWASHGSGEQREIITRRWSWKDKKVKEEAIEVKEWGKEEVEKREMLQRFTKTDHRLCCYALFFVCFCFLLFACLFSSLNFPHFFLFCKDEKNVGCCFVVYVGLGCLLTQWLVSTWTKKNRARPCIGFYASAEELKSRAGDKKYVVFGKKGMNGTK